MQADLPFKNLVLIELANVLAGPSVGMFFAELGATVIKVENTGNGDVTRSWKLPDEKSPLMPEKLYKLPSPWVSSDKIPLDIKTGNVPVGDKPPAPGSTVSSGPEDIALKLVKVNSLLPLITASNTSPGMSLLFRSIVEENARLSNMPTQRRSSRFITIASRAIPFHTETSPVSFQYK